MFLRERPPERAELTFIDVRLFRVLLRIRILHDNVVQLSLLKVLLTRLLVRSVFSSVLLHRLERILFPTLMIGSDIVEELVRLLAHFEKVAGWITVRHQLVRPSSLVPVKASGVI